MMIIVRAGQWVARRWVDLCMSSYYAFIVATGLLGFRDPSVSIVGAIGTGYLIYAAGMTVMGLLALVSVVTTQRRAEVVCLIFIALLTVLHGVMLISGGPAGYQSGTRLLAAFPFAAAFAFYRRETVATRGDVRRSIAAAERLEQTVRDRRGEGSDPS